MTSVARDCSIKGCGRKHSEKGYCKLHASRLRRGADLEKDTMYGRTDCNTSGCNEKHYCKGFCRRCHSYIYKYRIDPLDVAGLKTRPCDICGESGITIHVDHDHSCCPGDSSCGKCVRGFLCKLCNVGLGSFRDSPDRLRRAADYLQELC